ncbi:hypothetical protein P692DRAFT_20721388, partial [Suillus brevipes Sb2]
ASLKGAKRLAPPTSKRPKRTTFTITIITVIRATLDLDHPLHTAVFACLTTFFFTIARTGEFTVTSLLNFRDNPQIHIRVDCMWQEEDQNGFKVTVFRLLRTKTSLDGEDVYWAAQSGPTDPKAALLKHLAVNNPPPSVIHQSTIR